MSDPGKAVFLSYASQDAEAAKRICEALRSAGVEVWFDQNELVGGDAWDARIRGQIGSCGLFVPIISANTQARLEGYFRIEWKLAARRTHAMATAKAFLLPVVIDETHDAAAHVPDEFRDVQWTKLKGGEAPPAFVARVRKLLSKEPGAGSTEQEIGAASGQGTQNLKPRTESRRLGRLWWALPMFGVAMALLLVMKEGRKEPAPTPASTPVTTTASSTELARIRARIIPDRWQKGDFDAVSPALDRLIQADPENADAWALRSVINSLQVVRNIDSGTKPLEQGKAAADHALRLTPESPLAELALGIHLLAMTSRGGDPQAGGPHIARAVAKLPPDALTRFADLISAWAGYDSEATEANATAWLTAEPAASYPAWILAQSYLTQRRPVDVEKWAEAAALDRNITGTRAIFTHYESDYYLRADLAAAKATLARVPAGGQAVHRIIHARWLVAMAEGRWDEALQDLARVPESMLYDRTYHGPRALLAGLAHQRAGRADAALAQFREAERLLRSELAADTDNEELHLALAVALACAGRAGEARSELAQVEPLVKGRAPSIYWGALAVSIAQAHGVLGDFGDMAGWLRKIFVQPNGFPFTPASLRLDPRFTGMLEAPVVQALLKEFAHLDQPVTPSAISQLSPPSSPPPADSKSVAVLAFANLSDDKANEYFSDGISEELLNVLAKVPDLKVTARTSSFHFKGKDTPIPEIAQQLGVAYVVEGSVRKQGDKVRITAQLIKAADGFHVWSDTFTRDLKDIFAVQDEIAGLIATQLSLKLGVSSAAATAAVNPQVLELYLQARQAWNLRTVAGYDRAEELLNRGLALEPNFARAHAALADVWQLRGEETGRVGRFDQRHSSELARIAAEARQALALDPDSAEAHASAGSTLMAGWNFSEAERELRRALELNPNYASAHQWLGRLRERQGLMDEALAELKVAAELDPFSARIAANYAVALYLSGQTTAAIATFDRALAARPGELQAIRWKSMALARLGRHEEALALIRRRLSDDPRGRLFQILVLAKAGLTKEAEALLPGLEPNDPLQLKILCQLALGRRAEAMALLESGALISNGLDGIFFDEDYDPLRGDPRFAQVLNEVGLTEAHARAQAWRAAHPPEKPKGKQ